MKYETEWRLKHKGGFIGGERFLSKRQADYRLASVYDHRMVRAVNVAVIELTADNAAALRKAGFKIGDN